jgi:hypothetical protein
MIPKLYTPHWFGQPNRNENPWVDSGFIRSRVRKTWVWPCSLYSVTGRSYTMALKWHWWTLSKMIFVICWELQAPTPTEDRTLCMRQDSNYFCLIQKHNKVTALHEEKDRFLTLSNLDLQAWFRRLQNGLATCWFEDWRKPVLTSGPVQTYWTKYSSCFLGWTSWKTSLQLLQFLMDDTAVDQPHFTSRLARWRSSYQHEEKEDELNIIPERPQSEHWIKTIRARVGWIKCLNCWISR